jgi:hypothetical protein
MKRLALFWGRTYYPCGGWDDFGGTFDTIEDAQAAAREHDCDWAQIVDLNTERVVIEGGRSNFSGPLTWKVAGKPP